MKDYYEILGITNNATENNIYVSYKNKIAQFNHLPFHTSKMIEDIKSLKEALYVLSDKNKRTKYDNKRDKRSCFY
jgi:DnaJ-class molecular chaperone